MPIEMKDIINQLNTMQREIWQLEGWVDRIAAVKPKLEKETMHATVKVYFYRDQCGKIFSANSLMTDRLEQKEYKFLCWKEVDISWIEDK